MAHFGPNAFTKHVTTAWIELCGKEIYAYNTPSSQTGHVQFVTRVISNEQARGIAMLLVTALKSTNQHQSGELRGKRMDQATELSAILYGTVSKLQDGSCIYYNVDVAVRAAAKSVAEQPKETKSRSRKGYTAVAGNITPQYVMMVQTELGTIPYIIGNTTLETAAGIVASQIGHDKKTRWLELHQGNQRNIVPFDEILQASKRMRTELLLARTLIQRAL